MTPKKQTTPAAAQRTMANEHETMMKTIAEPLAPLHNNGDWAGEIGNRIVYLKFHAASSFQLEQEVMLGQRVSSYAAHRKQHEGIVEELNRLFRQVVRAEATRESVTEALHGIVNRLKRHAAEYDGELLKLTGKEQRRSAPALQVEAFFPRPKAVPAVCFYTA